MFFISAQSERQKSESLAEAMERLCLWFQLLRHLSSRDFDTLCFLDAHDRLPLDYLRRLRDALVARQAEFKKT